MFTQQYKIKRASNIKKPRVKHSLQVNIEMFFVTFKNIVPTVKFKKLRIKTTAAKANKQQK